MAIAIPLAQGLAHIHRAGVVHRDIKPANILVRRSDQQPVLIDFGAAKQAVAEHSRSLAPYTEGYAALEQVADGQLGPWTDLYGFGAVLWRMVAGGNPPWDPPNPVKVESRATARVREADDPLPMAKELGAGRFAEQILETIDGCLQLNDTERIRESDRVVELLEGTSEESHQTAIVEQEAEPSHDVDLPDPVSDGTGYSSTGRWWKVAGLAAAVTAAFALVVVVLVPRNRVLAAKYSAIACNGGIAASCSDLGTAYRFGDGVPRDDFHAAELYERACGGGHAEGCVRLGNLYIEGEGVPKDVSRAARLFERVCEGGYPTGCFLLAGMYYAGGKGVSEDRVRAADLFERVERACDSGDAESCFNVAFAYETGIAVSEDRAHATEFFRRSCGGGYADGCFGLGTAYQHGVGVGEDQARAWELFQEACDKGSNNGCLKLGSRYFEGPAGDQDYVRAAEFFKRACDGRNSNGCLFLGVQHIKGIGVSKDVAHGIELIGWACDQGSAEACSTLGVAYRDGEGVDKDEARARVFFERACKKGEFSACLQACDGDLDCILSMAEKPE